MKVKFILITLSLLISLRISAQNVASFDSTIKKVQRFLDHHITEKAYLHFDKPYYAAGDTMYFKTYVLVGEKYEPSKISGVLHVDLIDPQQKIIKSIKLQLLNGLAWGDFSLPDTLQGGNYRVRAYTRWMQNNGNTSFFDRNFRVVALHGTGLPENNAVKLTHIDPDIQFFPEGGSLVSGIENKVAFKCIGPDGLGMDVKGEVIDDKGMVISNFASTHLGMGNFLFTPLVNETYQAKVTFANGSTKTIDLPKADEAGVTLKLVNDTADSLFLQLASNRAFFAANYNQKFDLVIYASGAISQRTAVLNARNINIALPKNAFHSGVLTVSVLDHGGQPLTERLVFLWRNDQLKLALDTTNISSHSRGKVQLNFSMADTSLAHFSVSVTDKTKVEVNENEEHTILTDMLLNSNLSGYIEQPNYYFLHDDEKTHADLDLVMLTHGYRHFSWKSINNEPQKTFVFQPETGISVKGVVKSLLGKRLDKATVNLLHFPDGVSITTQTNSSGEYSFNNLMITDTVNFVVQATNIKRSNKTRIFYAPGESSPPIINENTKPDTALNTFLINYSSYAKQKNSDDLKVYIHGKLLKEVTVKALKKEGNYRSSNIAGPGHADQVYFAAQLEHVGGSLSDKLMALTIRGRVLELLNANKYQNKKSSLLDQGGPLVIVDGANTSSSFKLDYIDASSVEAVEFLFGANASIYGMSGGHGVIIITTKTGADYKSSRSEAIGILPITVTGFYKAREFYSPKYEVADKLKNQRDLRSTIYWQPELVTDKQGHVHCQYFNADGPGTYQIVVEGIDEQGHLGRFTYLYKVE